MPPRKAPKTRTTRSSPATTTTTTTPVTDAQLKALIDQGVADALAVRDADRSRNGEDSHDSGMGVRRQAPLTHECTYPDFMKCKPLYFNGTEGVVELTQWFERMENVFRIGNCSVENQIKFATCTDMVGYNQCFQELALMCARMFLEDSDKIERTRGRTLARLTLQGLVRRNPTEDLNLCALNATIIMTVNVLQNATSATELAIWPVIVGVLQMPILLTTKGALTRDCRTPAATNNQINLTCYECGNQGHYKRRGGETDQDPNNIEDEIKA
ncbi:hypothetical protein Tco_0736540 [Tanacetum coccineum]